MGYKYKTVAAPARAKKHKGTKSRAERLALTFEEILNEQAADGWEYLRTDILPVEEKAGPFSKNREVHRALLVFQKSTEERGQRLFDRPSSHQPAPHRTTEGLPPLPEEYDDALTEPRMPPGRLAR